MTAATSAWLPYCGAGAGPADWFERWNADPVLIGAVAALLIFGHFNSRETARLQIASALVVVILFVSPLCALGSALFAFRVGHHLALALILAPLLAFAMPAAGRFARVSLPLATVLQAAVFWAWHVPAFYEAALENDAAFWAMQISITGSAMLWWAALRRASPLAATATLLATMVQMGLLGALIVFAGRPLYAPHWLTTAAWGLSPLEDQQVAGLLMWVVGGGAYLALAAALLYRALAPRARAPARMIGRVREWAEQYRSQGRYTPVGVAFHWIMAAVVIFQLGSGWWMERYLAGADKREAYTAHVEIGLTLLVLGLLRLLWRTIVPGPVNDADKPGLQSKLAHATHAAFYALFTIVPLSGWAMWSAIRPAEPLYFAGLVPVPAMPFHDLSRAWQFAVLDWSLTIHLGGTILLALLVIVHALSAIKHHLVDRDDVFEGMLPELTDHRHHPEGPQHSPPPLAVDDAKASG